MTIFIEKRGSSSSPNQSLDGDMEESFAKGKAEAMAAAWPTIIQCSKSQYTIVESGMSSVIDRGGCKMPFGGRERKLCDGRLCQLFWQRSKIIGSQYSVSDLHRTRRNLGP